MGPVVLGEEAGSDLRESWRGVALAGSARNLLTSPGDERLPLKTAQRWPRVHPSESAAAQIPLILLARFCFGFRLERFTVTGDKYDDVQEKVNSSNA
jgi:hypothetical protein